MSNYKVCVSAVRAWLLFILLIPCFCFQVADIALAAWGRKDIVLSENEMPGEYSDTAEQCTVSAILTFTPYSQVS